MKQPGLYIAFAVYFRLPMLVKPPIVNGAEHISNTAEFGPPGFKVSENDDCFLLPPELVE